MTVPIQFVVCGVFMWLAAAGVYYLARIEKHLRSK